ncbi:NAD-dependent epimerase/dehydratase family protein [Pseudophaeobacter arcticus]|uniref:NAD-dependent epimerase/dehydratase family protein n=1 Tax=Pseudophaeobacter arcticus TaxID=385492 RepID=UPI0036D2DC0B
MIFADRKILGLHGASTARRVSRKQRRYMGFPVTVVLGASGRIGTVLRHCWPGIVSPSHIPAQIQAQIFWQSRRGLGALPTVQPTVQPIAQPAPAAACLLDPLAEPQRLTELLCGAEVVLCLAGSVPGRGTDLGDNSRLATAAVQAAAGAADLSGAPAARVLLASSAAVYGNQPGLLGEDSPLKPANAYGVAKVEMEHQARALGQQLGVPVTALRIGNIAGLDAILGGWQPGFCLDQFADGRSPRRSYIGPQTLARILAALVAAADLPPALNLAQPVPLEMAALLRAADLPFAWRPAPGAAIAEVELDLRRLQHVLRGSAALAPAEAPQILAEWTKIEPVLTAGPHHSTDQKPPKEPHS